MYNGAKFLNTEKNKKYFYIAFFLFFLIQLAYYLSQYFQYKGFNPSDDGVILAQSWRIINGQIPHIDFISIRPVLSAYIHTIHFIGIFPLELSARIFTSLEYYVYSFIWCFLFFKIFSNFFKTDSIIPLFILSLTICYALNQNYVFIWPWTSVDAILLASLSVLFTYYYFYEKDNFKFKNIQLFLAFFFASLAILIRQTFTIYSTFLFLFLFLYAIKGKKNLINFILIFLLGNIPIIIYGGFFIYKNSFFLLTSQVLSGSSVLGPAFKHPLQNLLFSFPSILPLAIICLYLLFIIRKRDNEVFYFYIEKLVNKSKLVSNSTKIFFILFIISNIILSVVFIMDDKYLLQIPYIIFWSFTCLVLAMFLIKLFSFNNFIILSLAILIGWVSAISYGLPTPLFMTGVFLTGSVFLIGSLYKRLFKKGNNNDKVINYRINILSYVFSICVFVLYINISLNNNYRDLKRESLKYSISHFLSGLDGIKLNRNIYEYYIDLCGILKHLPDWRDKVAFLPNNSILYPLLKTQNPMPLDWIQYGEYRGSEETLIKQISNLFFTKKVYLILDKYNSKALYLNNYLMDYNSQQYSNWYSILSKRCKLLEIQSKYFYVYTN